MRFFLANCIVVYFRSKPKTENPYEDSHFKVTDMDIVYSMYLCFMLNRSSKFALVLYYALRLLFNIFESLEIFFLLKVVMFAVY